MGSVEVQAEGIALLSVTIGLLAALTGLDGCVFPVVRNAEGMLPDDDAVVARAQGF